MAHEADKSTPERVTPQRYMRLILLIVGGLFVAASLSLFSDSHPRTIVIACQSGDCTGFEIERPSVFDISFNEHFDDEEARSVYSHADLVQVELLGDGVWRLGLTTVCSYALKWKDSQVHGENLKQDRLRECRSGRPVAVSEIADHYDQRVFARERRRWQRMGLLGSWGVVIVTGVVLSLLLFGRSPHLLTAERLLTSALVVVFMVPLVILFTLPMLGRVGIFSIPHWSTAGLPALAAMVWGGRRITRNANWAAWQKGLLLIGWLLLVLAGAFFTYAAVLFSCCFSM